MIEMIEFLVCDLSGIYIYVCVDNMVDFNVM